jgi:hypothetical protein
MLLVRFIIGMLLGVITLFYDLLSALLRILVGNGNKGVIVVLCSVKVVWLVIGLERDYSSMGKLKIKKCINH